MKGNVFIITSPSGGGKGTLIKRVLPKIENLKYSVSYTTRQIREGEVHGQHYFFIKDDEFEKLIEKEEFLEYAKVHGNFYGTSKSQVEKETNDGNDIILEIDVQGAKLIQEKLSHSIGIFILPPSYKILTERLIERNTEEEKDIFVRLNNAKKEVKEFQTFDYIVINDDLEKSTKGLESIFIAEKLKRDRQIDHIQDILNSFENY